MERIIILSIYIEVKNTNYNVKKDQNIISALLHRFKTESDAFQIEH